MTETEIRDRTKKKLATYYQMAEELKDVEAEMEELEDLMTAIRAQVITGMPRGSTVGDPTSSMAVKLASLKEHYDRLRDQELDRRLEIETMLTCLEPIERRVIRLRFLEGLPWRSVSQKILYSETQTRRFYEQGLDKLVAEELLRREGIIRVRTEEQEDYTPSCFGRYYNAIGQPCADGNAGLCSYCVECQKADPVY